MKLKNSSSILNLVLIIFLSASGVSAAQPIIERGATFHPFSVPEEYGMVVSQDQLASDVGAEILAMGGNAVDAAVATGFALAVSFPQAGNLGGGGFMMIYMAEPKETVALDYREVAPKAAFSKMFLNSDGEVDNRKSRSTALSSGVPGTVAGLIDAQDRYGLLSRQQVLEPAIRMARNGIVVSDSLAWSLSQASRRFQNYVGSRQYFLDENQQTPGVGDLWVQEDLANTLTLISEYGKAGFYSGVVAEQIVAESDRHGGLISLDDLNGYAVVYREPLRGTYGEYEILSMPPPSSGGLHLLQILKMLRQQNIGAFEHNSAGYLHRLVESMKYAYVDRSLYLGDPDFVEVPVSRLLSDSYLLQRSRMVVADRAIPSAEISAAINLPVESTETTHFSVWDGYGNVVSNTYTLNFSYGNGIAVQGAGFLLNNEMDDFSALPGAMNAYGLVGSEANAIESGKRPLSSMAPTIVFKNGAPVIATGSPGGSAIITIVAQVLLNMLEFEMNPAQAVSVPRIHHQWLPDSIRWEPGISADTRAAMEAMGHKFDENPRVWGKAETISLQDGYLKAGVDPRWPGSGAAAPESAQIRLLPP